ASVCTSSCSSTGSLPTPQSTPASGSHAEAAAWRTPSCVEPHVSGATVSRCPTGRRARSAGSPSSGRLRPGSARTRPGSGARRGGRGGAGGRPGVLAAPKVRGPVALRASAAADVLAAELSAQGANVAPGRWAPEALVVARQGARLRACEAYRTGRFVFQGEP